MGMGWFNWKSKWSSDTSHFRLTLMIYRMYQNTFIRNTELSTMQTARSSGILRTTGRAQLQYSSVPELSTESLPNLRLPPFQLNYIDYLIRKNDTSSIRLLEYLGVQYLVIREDYRVMIMTL